MLRLLEGTGSAVQRLRVRVRGSVQGVGFRPFVYGLAQRYELGGFVTNDAEGVLIEVEGMALPRFLAALGDEAPPLARIDAIETASALTTGERVFRIARSRGGVIKTRVAADNATCDACLADLFDPASRFYRYPFVNCTHCGPRYTITGRLPYDRANTSMRAFAVCEACARDYADPDNRRFHAEPIACPRCGPRLSHSIDQIVERIRVGGIVALKGLGGFHLVCDARNEAAVATLRRRKQRDAKPFAVMVASPASAEAVAEASGAVRALLASRERPIALLRSRRVLAPSVAPGLAHLGVMLPYTPLHHLLFHEAAGAPADWDQRTATTDLVLVATSANPGGEPLVIDDRDAERRLGGIADLIVTHDRPIVVRADDSVTFMVDGAPAFLRRARGHVPCPIVLPREVPSLLAVGALLKNTVTVTRGREAFVSQHVGDLDNAEAVRFFEETIAHLLSILDVDPVGIAHDLHPDFASTRFAEAFGRPTVAVQHHHAHVAAIAAEHRIDGPILGLVLDGFGRGSDGGSWGGELLLADGAQFRRLGHLQPLALPGGDAAAREPWRMAAAALHALQRNDEIPSRYRGRPQAPRLAAMLARDLYPATTSAGRLFDAAAGLLGICDVQHYEGQAAMQLEALVASPAVLADGWSVKDGVLDLTPLLESLAMPGVDRVAGAELFHGTFAAALADWAERAARTTGISTVALGGGCFLNRVLTEALVAALRARGLAPLLARALPPNDGGISLGQVWVAASALVGGRSSQEAN